MLCKGYKNLGKYMGSHCVEKSYHAKHNAADNNKLLFLRSESHYVYCKHMQTHLGVREILLR